VSWNTLAQYENVDLDRCFEALRQADTNNDLKIDEGEYNDFLQLFGPVGFLAELEERPLVLRGQFYAVACMCLQRGEDSDCCIGDNAVIDISGARDGATQEDQDYLQTACTLTQRAIDSAQSPERLGSGRQEMTSVWLRTTYQVATSGSIDFLSDLTDAMNTLVPEVLEEATEERRRLQQVESLPTQLESTPIGTVSLKVFWPMNHIMLEKDLHAITARFSLTQ
jgi:hypothetical protein